jgi:hypothetical protein
MKINELIFDMIVEEIKANQKTFFNELMTKWKTEVPELTDEQGEKVFNRHNNIKNQISIENSAIVRFLKRHDGRFPDKKKYTLNDLKQIQVFNFKDLVSFLVEYGKFEMGDKNTEENPEDEKAKLEVIFSENGNQSTEAKVESSKAMWFSDENCIINKGGVRVYKILNETHAKRMGYYYQSLHKQQYVKYRQERTASVNSPWCVTWRGGDVRVNDDEGNYIYGNGTNQYGYYRRSDKKTFYFVIDDNKNYLSEDVEEARFHMCALQINNYGSYTVSSMFNDGDQSKSWDYIISVYPQLDGEKDKIEWRAMSDAELESAKITDTINETPGDPNEFSAQTPQRMTEYISQGGVIKEVDSWNAMPSELKTAYITMMQLHDATSRISNTKLLTAIIRTSPPDFPYMEKLDRKLKQLGKNGIEYIVNDFMQKDYVLVRKGQRDSNYRIYQSKINHLFGIYHISSFGWVMDGNTQTEYNDRFSEDKMIRTEDEQGKRYAVKSYSADNGDAFYVIIDNPTLSDGGEAQGFLVSKTMWDNDLSKQLTVIEGKRVQTMVGYETGKYGDIQHGTPSKKKKEKIQVPQVQQEPQEPQEPEQEDNQEEI